MFISNNTLTLTKQHQIEIKLHKKHDLPISRASLKFSHIARIFLGKTPKNDTIDDHKHTEKRPPTHVNISRANERRICIEFDGKKRTGTWWPVGPLTGQTQ